MGLEYFPWFGFQIYGKLVGKSPVEDMAFWGKFFFAVGDKIHREIGGALKNGTLAPRSLFKRGYTQ